MVLTGWTGLCSWAPWARPSLRLGGCVMDSDARSREASRRPQFTIWRVIKLLMRGAQAVPGPVKVGLTSKARVLGGPWASVPHP